LKIGFSKKTDRVGCVLFRLARLYDGDETHGEGLRILKAGSQACFPGCRLELPNTDLYRSLRDFCFGSYDREFVHGMVFSSASQPGILVYGLFQFINSG